MTQLYYPYIVGTDDPISYLFEKISPFVTDEYNIRIHTNGSQQIFGSDRITAVPSRDDDVPYKLAKFTLASLKRCDLVHTGGNGEIGYAVSQLTRLRSPGRAHVHSLRVDVVPEFEGRNTTIRRWTANDADVVTAVSEHTAETARREFGIDPTVIYNGVDTDLFNPGYDWPQTFDKLNLSSPPFVYVGAFWDRKRPHDVVEVAKRCPSHDFVMIGDGGTYEEVKKAASGVENVFLTGRLPKASLPAIYANALGLIFPTVQEGCPNVVLEAMSSETPVIGYEATSMPELVTTGTSGYLTDVGNLASLAEGVERVSNHSDEMGANARNYIQQNHTFDRIASQYMSVYRRALGGAEV